VSHLSTSRSKGGLNSAPRMHDDTPRLSSVAKQRLALLVYEQEGPIHSLEPNLISQGMRIQRCRSCSEAQVTLREPNLPSLILTDVFLPDGTWEEVLKAANAAPGNVPVIVVSRAVEMTLYLDVLETGAHDFVVPPVSFSDLAYIIRTAVLKSSS
jgi:DNA-binding NtrC family response regulator